MEIELQSTLEEALSSGINLILGSGFSILASNTEGSALPTGRKLAEELCSEFQLADLKDLSLDKLSTILESSQRERFHQYLKKRFRVLSFSPKYSILDTLNIKSILSTNIDDLVQNIFANSVQHYVNDITKRGVAYKDRFAINFAPLHGSISDDPAKFAFSTLDIASAFSADRDKWHFLTGAIQQFPSLFWGYAMNDSGILEALSPRTIADRDHQTKWIILTEPTTAEVQYFKALNFNIIKSDTEEFLNYLDSLDIVLRERRKIYNTKERFPEYIIPPPGKVPVRPLIDFYLGDAPIWSDIYTDRIYRTEYFNHIKDSIHAKQNVVVLGIPACGKTTLLMQVAADIKYDGHKLVCNSLTLEKAKFIIRELGSERAIVFVDNFADDVDAFQCLLNSNNILCLGFDRDYNFEIASHRFTSDNFKILEVTSINDKDMQGILARIPADIKAKTIGGTASLEIPSVFEIIQTNTNLPRLQERFKGVVSEIEKQSTDLTDLLVMMCYVDYCRTPVSFEMVFSFLRSTTSNYEKVYEMVDQLGAMLTNHVPLASLSLEQDQDYWAPRSTIIAEAIIDQVPSNILKRALLRFHEEVSPYRICRYDVFRRRAYDHTIMRRAFPDWNEGKKFYEILCQIDASPYIRQQGALYLSDKRRFRDAFAWIDEALIQSKYKVFTIRNSHAIILFKANIDGNDDDPTVKQTLNQSMEILAQCYKDDKRKIYHAIIFADQAISYFEKYGDSVARTYLKTANQWLKEELEKSSWNRNLKRMYERIKKLN